MNLDDALDQIAAIRSQMASSAVFRGYRCASTLFSAFIAVVTAVVQYLWIPDARNHVNAYMALWFGAGGLCLLVVSIGVISRYRRSESPLDRALCFTAAKQFLPCLIAGGLITYILADAAWYSLWIAPGLWAIFFGMGILASRPLLPAGTTFVGAFYLLCGMVSIEWSHHVQAFSPWVMAIPFGVGQSLAAGILYWNLERHDAPSVVGEGQDA